MSERSKKELIIDDSNWFNLISDFVEKQRKRDKKVSYEFDINQAKRLYKQIKEMKDKESNSQYKNHSR